MPESIDHYSIFIASPGGLEEIRKTFRDEVHEFNKRTGRRRKIVFDPVGWEDTLGSYRRPQALINDELKRCDRFLLVLWNRWGSPPDTEEKFTSGCHEEYELARKCIADEQKAMEDVVVFFRGVDPQQLADPGPQLQQVLEFRQELEGSKEILFMTFDEVDEFRRDLRRLLDGWLYQAEHGVRPAVAPREAALNEADPERSESPVLAEAERLADEGKLTEAEVLFARATASGNDPDAFHRFGQFLVRVGRIAQAEVMWERMVTLAEDHGREWEAKASGGLGVIYRIRGELDRAEKMHQKALEIAEQFGSRRGMAAQYGNLGLIYRSRGELDRAEKMHQKALKIDEQRGSRKGMARHLGNLGLIYQSRGELERAEKMHQKALEIDEQLGSREGMAADYCNLGLIYQSRGELERAEEMQQKGLQIHEQLGNREGTAIQYGNLGVIYWSRGELDRAEEVLQKGLQIHEQLGSRKGMARHFGNLGLIYESRGELDRAEEMQQKALEIDEQVGSREGMAFRYGNLGLIYERRGELDRAEEMHQKALEIDEQLGSREGMARHFSNLGLIYKSRGELDRARAAWKETKRLWAEMGVRDRLAWVEGELEELGAEDS